MSLACLACYVESSRQSFRSYSVSSSENEGRCAVAVNCLTRSNMMTSKVTPAATLNVGNSQGGGGGTGTPRLIRSRAVRRDIVQDWNFEEVLRS